MEDKAMDVVEEAPKKSRNEQEHEDQEESIKQLSCSYSCFLADDSEQTIDTMTDILISSIRKSIREGIMRALDDKGSFAKMDVKIGIASNTVCMGMNSHHSPDVTSLDKFTLRCKKDTAECYECNGGFNLEHGYEGSTGFSASKEDESYKDTYRFRACNLCSGTGFICLEPLLSYMIILRPDGLPDIYEIEYPHLDNFIEYVIKALNLMKIETSLHDQTDDTVSLDMSGSVITFIDSKGVHGAVGMLNQRLYPRGVAIKCTDSSRLRYTTEHLPTRILRRFYTITWHNL